MEERRSLLGKMPDKATSTGPTMTNDRYLTGLGLLLTVVVVSSRPDGMMETWLT
jgi:hypothetical protein